MGLTPYRSVFISDVHLGSSRSCAESLLSFLATCECHFLYIVGDLADAWEDGIGQWPAEHHQVLELLGSKASSGTRLFFLPGNHDRGFRTFWRRTLPHLDISRELRHTTADGRRFLVLHGDRFDMLERRAPWVIRGAERLSGWIERALSRLPQARSRDSSRHPNPSSRRFRQAAKRFIGYTGRFERRAVSRAKRLAVDGVICGHSHAPNQRVIRGIEYHNGGDWVASCTALVEHINGRIELVRWKMP